MATPAELVSQLIVSTQSGTLSWYAVDPNKCNPPVDFYSVYNDWRLDLTQSQLGIYSTAEKLTTINSNDADLTTLYSGVQVQLQVRAAELITNLYDQLQVVPENDS